MQKSPLQSKYLRALADLNDQFCYFLFARHELRSDFSGFDAATGELMLPNVFATNPYAPKINVRIREVPAFEADHERVTFGAYVSTSYEVASGYLEEALHLLSRINTPTFHRAKARTLEESYWATLNASKCTTPDAELRLTLAYLRMRRNHFIHLTDKINIPLADLIKNNGAVLNKYWHPTIRELDFTALDITSFAERESIDMLMLLRIIIQRLDEHLASQFDCLRAVEFVAAQLFGSHPSRINEDVVKERLDRLNAILERDFKYHSPDAEAESIVRRIGVR
jgi:hypothetical protein